MPSSLPTQRASLGTGSNRAALRSRLATLFSVAVALAVLLPGPALAIPSPDVMVNLFASAAQVLGLLSIVFGRWFFVSRRRARAGGAQSPLQKVAFATSVVLCLSASEAANSSPPSIEGQSESLTLRNG